MVYGHIMLDDHGVESRGLARCATCGEVTKKGFRQCGKCTVNGVQRVMLVSADVPWARRSEITCLHEMPPKGARIPVQVQMALARYGGHRGRGKNKRPRTEVWVPVTHPKEPEGAGSSSSGQMYEHTE